MAQWRLAVIGLAVWLGGVSPAHAEDVVQYSQETLTAPRPLAVYRLRVDLTRADLELAVAVSPDPDGDGPAQAQLERPVELAATQHLLAAVNSNAFGAVADPTTKQTPNGWAPHQPVTIIGLAVSGGIFRSQPRDGYIGFWVDDQGRAHLGNPQPADAIHEGCAGFNWLVQEGQLRGDPGDKHPRTAIGLDREGHGLWLVVVDGRQPGYSEGMSTKELADYMLQLGCWNAVNLDGGGSSIMLLRDAKGALQTMNRPSTRFAGMNVARPVPVMLGVRLKAVK